MQENAYEVTRTNQVRPGTTYAMYQIVISGNFQLVTQKKAVMPVGRRYQCSLFEDFKFIKIIEESTKSHQTWDAHDNIGL